MFYQIDGLVNIPPVIFDDEKITIKDKVYYYDKISSITLSNTIFTSPSGIMHIKYEGKEYTHPFNRNRLAKMKNAIQEYETIKKRGTIPKQQNPYDEIKQLKELLDMGAITQEEYDMKKKQLLNL